MITCMKDFIDCLLVVFGEIYGYKFLFGHKSGYPKKRTVGLDVSTLKKRYGEVQLDIHTYIIKQSNSYLAPYHDPTTKEIV